LLPSKRKRRRRIRRFAIHFVVADSPSAHPTLIITCYLNIVGRRGGELGDRFAIHFVVVVVADPPPAYPSIHHPLLPAKRRRNKRRRRRRRKEEEEEDLKPVFFNCQKNKFPAVFFGSEVSEGKTLSPTKSLKKILQSLFETNWRGRGFFCCVLRFFLRCLDFQSSKNLKWCELLF
jgi:hypothetical protein